MRTATLTRDKESTPYGQFGILETDSGLRLHTGELGYHGNQSDISCILPGTYKVTWTWSEKHKSNLYHLMNVPGRNNIEIHSANFMGDKEQGYASQLLGCVAPGKAVVMFKAGTKYSQHEAPLARDQYGLTSSHDALEDLHRDMRDEAGRQVEFEICVKNG